MPRSNSSRGVADGGKVVSAALAPGFRAGGGGNPPGGLRAPPVFARSSGSPAPRPPGAPTGEPAGSGSWPPPRACGTPGAFGLWLGSRGNGGDVGLADGGLTPGRGLGAALKQPQALFELPVAVLQLFILAGELPQLILKLLNPHFRVGIVGLRESLRTKRQHRGHRRGAHNSMKSGRHSGLTTKSA